MTITQTGPARPFAVAPIGVRASILIGRWRAEQRMAEAMEAVAAQAGGSSKGARRGMIQPHAEGILKSIARNLVDAGTAAGEIDAFEALMRRYAADGAPIHHTRIRAIADANVPVRFRWECPCGDGATVDIDDEDDAVFAARFHAALGEGLEAPSSHKITVKPFTNSYDGTIMHEAVCSCGDYSHVEPTLKKAHGAGRQHADDSAPSWWRTAA